MWWIAGNQGRTYTIQETHDNHRVWDPFWMFRCFQCQFSTALATLNLPPWTRQCLMALTADHYSVAEDPSWLEILKRRWRLVAWKFLAVNVVNVSAEHGVKLNSDFLAALSFWKALPECSSRTEKRLPILEESINWTTTNFTFIQNGCYKYTHKGEFLAMIYIEWASSTVIISWFCCLYRNIHGKVYILNVFKLNLCNMSMF